MEARTKAHSTRGLRVLWATDGSAGSAAVTPVLNRLGQNLGRVRVLTVAPHKLVSGARPELAPLATTLKGGRAHELEDAQAVAVQQAIDIQDVAGCKEPVSVWGNPIQSILRQATEFKPDLTVLGSLGQSGLKFLLIGSVTSAVVQHSTGPVLVVRPGHEALHSVLLAYDGSVAARKAVTFLPDLLPDADTRITLVRAVEPFIVPAGTPLAYRKAAAKEASEILHQQISRARRSLKAPKAVLEAAGFTVQAEVLIGEPYLQLLEAAQRYDADLVAVGSRKPSRARHYLLGSTAERLVRHCGASVLVVR